MEDLDGPDSGNLVGWLGYQFRFYQGTKKVELRSKLTNSKLAETKIQMICFEEGKETRK